MNSFEQFKKNYKRDILVRIIQALKNGNMNRDEAREFSKLLIAIYKNPVEREVLKALSKLSQIKEEFLEVFLKRGGEYEAARDRETLSEVRKGLREYMDTNLSFEGKQGMAL